MVLLVYGSKEAIKKNLDKEIKRMKQKSIDTILEDYHNAIEHCLSGYAICTCEKNKEKAKQEIKKWCLGRLPKKIVNYKIGVEQWVNLGYNNAISKMERNIKEGKCK